MTATKTSKTAKDGAAASFNLEMATESGTGNIAQATYLAKASDETLIDPATSGNQTSANTKLDTINTTLGTPMQNSGGSVTANAGTNLNTSALVLDTTLTGGAAKTIARGGQKGTTNTNADITHTASGANHECMDIALYDASGNQIGSLLATAAKQPALGTAGAASADVITVQGVASMTALKVDGSAVTQPVSAASLPLPAGAATAAKQPAPGTAGTASADVITVQGKAGMTPVVVDASATSIQGGTVGSTPPTGANNVMMAALDSSGNVARFTLSGAEGTGVKVSEPDGLQVSPASVTSATTIFTQDMTGYEGIAVHVTSPGTTCTITYETSEDNINWLATTGMSSAYVSGFDTNNTTNSAAVMTFPRRGRYFRARVSTYTSGTVTVIYSLLKSNHVIPTAVGSVNGRSASGTLMVGPPVAIGFDARTSNLSVASGQAVYGVSTLAGAQIVYPFSIPELSWQFNAASGGIINTTTAVTLVAAAGAGVRNYCRSLSVHTNGTNAAGEIAIRDGAAGTVIWRGFMTANQANNIPPITFDPPLRGSANTLMEFVTLTAGGVSSALYVNAQGFQAP